jgi:transposase
MPPPRYPSDLSDQEWVILEPLLSSAEVAAEVVRAVRLGSVEYSLLYPAGA